MCSQCICVDSFAEKEKDDKDWNPWGFEFEGGPKPENFEKPQVAWKYAIPNSEDTKPRPGDHIVEIWGKAAIGIYKIKWDEFCSFGVCFKNAYELINWELLRGLNFKNSYMFLAATKQLYEWYFPSVCPSVRPSVRHTFLTMFPSSYHHEIFKSYYQWPT